MKLSFGRWLTTTDWSFLDAFPTCEEKVTSFNMLLGFAIETFFPLRKVKKHPTDRPWITPELKILIRQRQEAMLKDPPTYRKLRNKVNRLNHRLKNSFFERKVKNCKNPTSWWKCVKELAGISMKKKTPTSVIDPELGVEVHSIELATKINHEFLSITNSLCPLSRDENIEF